MDEEEKQEHRWENRGSEEEDEEKENTYRVTLRLTSSTLLHTHFPSSCGSVYWGMSIMLAAHQSTLRPHHLSVKFYWLIKLEDQKRWVAEDTCGGTVRGGSGVVTSPGYPGNYGNQADCTWILLAEPGDTISVIFTDFQTEEKYDYLEVEGSEPPTIWHYVAEKQDNKKTKEAKRQETREEWVEQRSRKDNWGDKGSQERRSGDERLSGSNVPSPIVSNKNWLRLHFMTDSNHRYRGFSAHYQGKIT
ncbi:hypothetical protein FQN60_007354, partial [Etheostoma spectabile]